MSTYPWVSQEPQGSVEPRTYASPFQNLGLSPSPPDEFPSSSSRNQLTLNILGRSLLSFPYPTSAANSRPCDSRRGIAGISLTTYLSGGCRHSLRYHDGTYKHTVLPVSGFIDQRSPALRPPKIMAEISAPGLSNSGKLQDS